MREREPRLPNPKKMARGLALINAFLVEVYMHDDGYKHSRNPFKEFPQWKTNPLDYAGMIRIARQKTREGIRASVEAAGWGGEAGSQFIIEGSYVSHGLNWIRILDKATDKTYNARRQTSGISEEESRELREAKPEDLQNVWNKIKARLPDRDEIRIRLAKKLEKLYQKYMGLMS